MIWKIGFLLVFSLFAINSVSGQGVTFTITNEADPGTRPPPPIPDLIEGPIGRDYYSKIGGGVYITAEFDTQGTPEQEVLVKWFRDDQEIVFNLARLATDTPPVFSFSIRSSTELFQGDTDTKAYVDTRLNQAGTSRSTLYLPNIDARFADRYRFEVISGSDSATASSNVFLGTPPVLMPTPPGITDPPDNNRVVVDLTGSGTFRQSCDQGFDVYATFEGDPAPAVTCTDTLNAGEQVSQTNANPLQTSVKYTSGPFPPSTTVTVNCIAINDHGQAVGSRALSIFGTPPRLSSATLPQLLDCTRAFPVVSVGMNERACLIDGEGLVTITHSLSQDGIPTAEIRWFHKDNFGVVREVVEGGRFTFAREGQNRVLRIQNPIIADEGEYFMEAANCVSSVSTEAISTRVNVYRPPVISPQPPIVPPAGSCQDNPNYRTVNVRENDFVLTDDTPVCILCPSSGIPDPTISWLRDNNPVAPNQGPANAQYLDATGLIVRDQPNCFVCRANNIAGITDSEVCVQAGLPLAYRLQDNGCTKTCGGGVIDYSIICVEIEGEVETVVDTNLCLAQQIPRPPIPTTICNAVDCPPQFLLGAWSACSSSCEEGTRTRTVRCRQIGANGIQRDVGISVCEDAGLTVPDATDSCNVIRRIRRTGDLNPCPVPENFQFEDSPWSACTQTCHLGRRTRTVRCREIDRQFGGMGRVYPDEVCIQLGHVKPVDKEVCGQGPCNNYGSWVCNAWGDCSTTCGAGGQLRTIFCYDTLTKSIASNCDLSIRPRSFQVCNEGPCLLTLQCIDNPSFACYVLRSSPRFCDSPSYQRICCKTCEDVIFRPVTTTTTAATTTTPAPTTTPVPFTTPPVVTTPPPFTLVPQ